MAKINLKTLEPTGVVKSLKGLKALFYGGNNLGKTLQCSRFDKPLVLATEPGVSHITCAKQYIHRWSEFVDCVNQLCSEKKDKEDPQERLEYQVMQDRFETIIVDTYENLVDLAEQHTCSEFGVRTLNEIEDSRTNGWAIYRKNFKQQIEKLCSYGYFIVFVGHAEFVAKDENGIIVTKKIKGLDYTDYAQPKGSSNPKSSASLLKDMCDFTFYCKGNGVDEEGKVIPSSLICNETKTVFARSRYPMPTIIKAFTAENVKEAILNGIDESVKLGGMPECNWERQNDSYTVEELLDLIKPYFNAIKKKYPDYIVETIESELGEGKKLSECDEEDVVPLEVIYQKFVSFTQDQGINIQ